MRTLLLNIAAAAVSMTFTTGIVAFADPANATIRQETGVRQLVRIDDLDLGSTSGRETAARRIRRAADQVCGVEDVRDLEAGRCRARASAQAMQALDARIASTRAADAQIASR